MKRDVDLIRTILLEVESQPVNQAWSARPLLTYTTEEVVYHIRLATDQGLVDSRILPGGSTAAVVLRLTNNGHEFLDAARSDTVWQKAKEVVIKATGTLTLQALILALPKAMEYLMKR